MADIKAGDVVKLKSGGVPMSVARVEDGSAYCEWQDGPKAMNATYAVVVLMPFDSAAGAAEYKASRGI